MKLLLAGLLVLAGCSAQRDELPTRQVGTGLQLAGDAADPKYPDNANQGAEAQDLGKRLNDATPFSKTLADQYGIGNATATRAAADHQSPAEKRSATTERATTK
ncbi:MAG: hypothetical protein VX346_25305 [Planctomycetota bacterium]|nr:hypothetical protein [Planctomycetota bacterium]